MMLAGMGSDASAEALAAQLDAGGDDRRAALDVLEAETTPLSYSRALVIAPALADAFTTESDGAPARRADSMLALPTLAPCTFSAGWQRWGKIDADVAASVTVGHVETC